MTTGPPPTGRGATGRRPTGRHPVPQQLQRVFVLLLCFWLAIPLFLTAYLAQDALPFVVAPELAADHPDQVYTPTGELFVPPPRFQARFCELAPPGSDCANETVAFISPPQALVLSQPATWAGGSLGVLLFRWLAAGCLAGGMWVLWRRLAGTTPRAAAYLLATAVLLTPWVMVPVSLGQNGPLMFLSACLGTERAAGWRRSAGVGAVLALTVVFKLSPIILIGLLLWQRRWEVAAWTVGLLAVLTAITAAVFPIGLFGDFVTATRALPETALGNPYNGAIDSVIFGFAPGLVQGGAGAALLLAARVALAAGVLWYVGRRTDRDVQWATAWVLLMLFLPMVWWHYLFVVLPAIAYAAVRARLPERALLALPIAAAVAVPISLPNGSGSAWPLPQALYLLAAIAVVVVLARESEPAPAKPSLAET